MLVLDKVAEISYPAFTWYSARIARHIAVERPSRGGAERKARLARITRVHSLICVGKRSGIKFVMYLPVWIIGEIRAQR